METINFGVQHMDVDVYGIFKGKERNFKGS